MSAPVQERVSATKVGGLLALLVVAWVVFLVWPDRAVVPPAPPEVRPPSKLLAVGLPDNVDFEGLPEIFAVWAGRAHWQDGKTRFAYWHPGERKYSYDLEATRVGSGFRFRELHERVNEELEEPLAEDSLIRFYRPNRVIADPVPRPAPGLYTAIVENREPARADVTISQPKIEVKPAPLVQPTPALPEPPKR